MDKESLTEKLLDLVEGRETPESWRNWWDEHETELEALLSRGEFLKLKPCRHGFQWVPVFGSQKRAIAILEKSGTAFEASNLYQERYLAELDAFCKEQERVQREKQKEFKANNPELFGRYPKFSKALAKVLDPSDEIKPAATEEQIGNQESVLDFTLPSQVREFFLLTAGINVSTGVIVELSGTFNLTIALIVSMTWAWGLCPGGRGSWMAKSAIIPLETNCCSQNSRTRTAYWSGGISLGMVSTHRLASWEFHCFSTASAAFHKVLRSAYDRGAFAGSRISLWTIPRFSG